MLVAEVVHGVEVAVGVLDARAGVQEVAGDEIVDSAGTDAEHNHRLCPEELGMRQSVIALNPHNAA